MIPAGQLELFKSPKPRGGKRRGAGRKPKGKRAGSAHKERPELKGRFPVHIVLRVNPEVGNLRKRLMYRALRQATLTVAKHELNFADNDSFFRIVHISIQRTHVHLLVEAANKFALARGMQGFLISAAKHVNREWSVGLRRRRRGSVFPDRYHEEIITTPTQARHALAYVLNNWRKHREDQYATTRAWNVDPFSTGVLFGGWREREEAEVMWRWRETYEPLFVFVPKTWLLREGWRKVGGTIPFGYVPGPRRK